MSGNMGSTSSVIACNIYEIRKSFNTGTSLEKLLVTLLSLRNKVENKNKVQKLSHRAVEMLLRKLHE